ncbi:uncharacterized protein LOC126376395 [Pectinophora gossypiella]|uniref:uncharacterized protein LOC126376395 n=1 Tax=Pectinophora gossypiella TaxID=13191 RepID=UPI00214F1B34|nr:uncharacterized protein LOC126376395 [Pectinophora gossypiella]
MVEIEALIRKQEDLLERVKKAYANYKKSPKDRITVTYIETRTETLQKLWESFVEDHNEIASSIEKSEREEFEYFAEDVYTTFEEVYMEYKTKLKDDSRVCMLSAQPSASTSVSTIQNATTQSCEVKLPQIHLPKFSGGYEEWETFHDMFRSLIHNNANLSAVQKLHYLKSCLSGEAEHLLKNLSTTETNYSEAWSQLTRRYSNKRYNANEVMKRLFSQKTLFSESPTAIKQLLDTTSACLKSLENLKIDTSSWDAIINHLVVSKLDHESRKLWELQMSETKSDEIPTWSKLKAFLETRFRTLEMLDAGKPTTKQLTNSTSNKQFNKSKSFHHTVNDEKKSTNTCTMCEGPHTLFQCKQFGKQSPKERSEYVQSKGLCFNCLSPTHPVKSCHMSTCCRRCGRRHHTLLHFERGTNQDSISNESPSFEKNQNTVQIQPNREPETKVVAHFAKESHQSKVLLATALVKVKSTSGYSLTVRALIDQGSEASFISEATAQALGLQRSSVNGLICGVGDGQTRTKNIVSCVIESIHQPTFSVPVKAFVLKKLTSFLPSKKSMISDWPEIQFLPLADPQYGTPGKIDLILGVEVHSEILIEGLVKHPSLRGPVAQNTQFGWILSGRLGGVAPSEEGKIVSLHIHVKEDQFLKQFWEIEREPDCIEKRMTKEEQRCEDIYEETTIRDEEGRYLVRLPFKSANPECLYGRSKEVALRRFEWLEKKLLKNPHLHIEYKKVMDDYLDQNHMVKIIEEKQLSDPYVIYLPHHAVIREDKETTKVRVVFDASSKGVNNVSLNENLLVGPKLQQDLRHILMRWRRHAICIVADLVQMYRQVRVNEGDTDFQRILWRANSSDPIQHYKLLRLTFGTACAPYLAVKSLQQLAKDEKLKYPIASKITLEDYYMDDLLTGCETHEQAVEIYEQMNELMKAGGFELQKWCSNSDELLEHIKTESQKSSQSVLIKSKDMKVLGITWNKICDNFGYTLQLPKLRDTVTKRGVLSDIAKLYDPMGWIAPVIFMAKVFIQKLWKSGLSWDENVTRELFQEWQEFREDLTNITKVIIPRWLQSKQDDKVELHVFADASQAGYAAAVYMKAKDKDGHTSANLISAKTKVAPVEKEISIPRMELCAALLATKLVYEVAQIMKVPKNQIFAWSDSTVTLAWLAGEPSRWTTFVSNRVSEILTMLDRHQWGHVNTNLNPADCASRGLSVAELIDHELWWHGPKWLQEDTYQKKTSEQFETAEEMKAIKVLTSTIQIEEKFIWTRFSELGRMLRVLSYCKKILKLRLPKEKRDTTKYVTDKETQEVLQFCIKKTQGLYFEEEIKQIKSNGSVRKNSQLHTLCPIIDECGLLRVGGRIHAAKVGYDKRHPIIMPSESHLTKLLVLDAHLRTLHGGPQLMLNLLRSKYWIIRARDLAKKCYRTCVKCVRYARQNNNQLMGQLPEARLKPSRPFKTAGVDFTGHINIRFSPGRGAKSYKGYICIFICMVSKAIHLEAVSDLTSQGFIAAFRRFVSRRGYCETLFSDNGTNFVGACKELQHMFDRSMSQIPDEISHLLANEKTTWKFIPPHAPNFGGLWEAGVRSAKTHLKRVIGDSTLTFEELSTVLTQIEACLNSRPLSYLSNNPEDPLPLTPGHFLVGEPLIVIPDEDYEKKNITGLQRWKLTQKMVNDFWRKWSNEYLVTLNQRYKWNTTKSEPQIDDIVFIQDHNLPPAKWLLGRIVDKHPGKDDIRSKRVRDTELFPNRLFDPPAKDPTIHNYINTAHIGSYFHSVSSWKYKWKSSVKARLKPPRAQAIKPVRRFLENCAKISFLAMNSIRLGPANREDRYHTETSNGMYTYQ